MTYRPAAGHRIIVRRTPGNHARTGVMTGLVLDVLTIGGVAGILDTTGPPTTGRAPAHRGHTPWTPRTSPRKTWKNSRP